MSNRPSFSSITPREEEAYGQQAFDGLLEEIVASTQQGVADASTAASSTNSAANPAVPLEAFLNDRLSPQKLLELWFGDFETSIRERGFEPWKTQAARVLTCQIAEIDRLLADQLNETLHHPRFQALEAAWRGVEMLINATSDEGSEAVRIRLLNLSWRELQRDFERHSEFDQSQIFKKIYEEEFGSPGGVPYGVLVGNYEIHPRPAADHPFDDIAVLEEMAGVAAAAFCPFVCAASPSLFGVDDFRELERTSDLAKGFLLPEFVKWRSLRNQEDARFVGVAMPRIIMRKPYETLDTHGFVFKEDVTAAHQDKYLWGNAAFAWATVLVRSFARSGWLADIRGVERNRDGGGLVTDLPALSFATDRPGVALRPSTDLVVTDQQEAELAKLGFLPLAQCHDTEYSAFYSSQSIQAPKKYDSDVATANASISTMLQYMLCVSRFAHYLKVIARDRVGAATEPEELQAELDGWIKQYVTPDDTARPDVKARRPLRQAEISVTKEPGKAGSYQCKFSLLPHYQLDDLSAAIRVQTTLDHRKD